MPVYEFVCPACGARFDRLLTMSAGDPSCPGCGGADVHRRLSVIAGLGGSGASAGSGCACGGACACGA